MADQKKLATDSETDSPAEIEKKEEAQSAAWQTEHNEKESDVTPEEAAEGDRDKSDAV